MVFGGKSAADNVILSKEHLSSGGAFTISRNDTKAMSIGVDGAVSVLAELLQVAGNLSVAGNLLGDGRSLDGVQQRVAGVCASGSAIRSVAADGNVTCESTTSAASSVTISAFSYVSGYTCNNQCPCNKDHCEGFRLCLDGNCACALSRCERESN